MAEELAANDKLQVNPRVGDLLACAPGQDYQLLLTSLPNGIDGARLKLSVLISPRLKPACDTTLSQYAPVFLDWPAALKAMQFQVFFAAVGGSATPISAIPIWSAGPPDSALWRAILPATMFVRGYQFDRSQYTRGDRYHPIALPERALHSILIAGGIYQNVALQSAGVAARPALLTALQNVGLVQPALDPHRPPMLAPALSVPSAFKELLDVRQQLLRRELQIAPSASTPINAPVTLTAPSPQTRSAPAVDTTAESQLFGLRSVPTLRDNATVLSASNNRYDARSLSLLEYRAFAQRSRSDFVRGRLPTTEDFQQLLDFHQVVASLSDYPELMKRLGLRLDFEIDVQDVPANGELWVRPVVQGENNRFITPRTRYTLQGGFTAQAASEGAEVSGGFLQLGQRLADGTSLFEVISADTEGAMAKMSRFSESLLSSHVMGAAGDSAELPSLRSTGLAVARAQRDAWLEGVLARAIQLNGSLAAPENADGTGVALTLEHLIRGYRIDVREIGADEGGVRRYGAWRSLCMRNGSYRVAGQPALSASDEGWIALGLTAHGSGEQEADAPAPGVDPVPLRLYESMFRWSGWSLCVPRPGKQATETVSTPQPEMPGFALKVAFAPVPGTLPALRFGKQYQFRARAVDLAGNSVPLETGADMPQALVTSEQEGHYDRFEPVPAPVLTLTAALKGAPSDRFPDGEPLSPGETLTRLIMRTRNVELVDEPLAAPDTPTTARHLLPAKTSQQLAEAHGMFDDPGTRKLLGAAAYQMMVAKDSTLGPENAVGSAHPEASIVTPYLPDPMASGAVLFNLPGMAENNAALWKQPYSGAWPDRRSFRLQLEGGAAAPRLDEGVLRVFLPPGEQRRIELSALPPEDSEQLFAISRWIRDHANAQSNPTQDELLQSVRDGRHAMVSPAREITLVHAVQQPVLTPRWVMLQVGRTSPGSNEVILHRSYGDTAAPMVGTLALHRASTEKFDVDAQWSEPIDQGVMTENTADWLYMQGHGTAFEVTVTPSPLASIVHALQTAPHAALTAATPIERHAAEIAVLSRDTNFIEPSLRERLDLPPAGTGPAPPPPPPVFDETPYRCGTSSFEPVPGDYGEQLGLSGVHRWPDTKYRCVNYRAVASTRYRDCFRPLPEENSAVAPRFTRSSALVKIDVLSSSPPEAPRVLYIVPTFRWEKTAQGSRRIGGGLRIYLERPWFTSGDGEQLAVVLYPDAVSELPEYAKPHVSQWGLDPLWRSAPPRITPGQVLNSGPLATSPLERPQGPALNPRVTSRPPLTESPAAPTLTIPIERRVTPEGHPFLPVFGPGTTHPTPGSFRNAAIVRYDVGVREVQLPLQTGLLPTPRTSLLAAAGRLLTVSMPVTICAFDVQPDPSRQLWYCDIEMDPGPAYYPFVRLALARYQVNSIPGAHLSRVVLADYSQLIPERAISVTRDTQNSQQLNVSLAGTMGEAAPLRGTQVEALIEQADTQRSGEPSWMPVSPAAQILNRADGERWAGTLTMPADQAGTQRRVVIREYEVFQIAEGGTLRQQERRLVYVDSVMLGT